MASFSELPSVVIVHILRLVTTDIDQGLRQWEKALPLLALSSSWRTEALPLVYRYGFIGEKTHDGSPPHIRTNVGLTPVNARIRNLRITKAAYCSPLKLMQAIVSALSPALANVTTVDFDEDLARDSFLAPEDAVAAAQRFASHVPQIASLSFNIRSGKGSRLAAFYTALSRYYTGTIQRLTHSIPCLCECPTPPQLTHLRLRLQGNTRHRNLGLVDFAHIEHLSIHRIGPGVLWSHIQKDSSRVVLPQLQYLELSNLGIVRDGMREGGDNKAAELWCPHLHTLRLEGESIEPHLLASLVRRAPLKKLELADWPAFLPIPLEDTASLEQLLVRHSLDNRPSHAASFYRFTNALFSRAIPHCRLALHGSRIGGIDPELVCWPHLTVLELNADVDLAQALLLVRQVPRLHRLRICRLVLDGCNGPAEQHDYLDRLRTRCLSPLPSSIIDRVQVTFRPYLTQPVLCDIRSLLSWYLPRLTHISIPES